METLNIHSRKMDQLIKVVQDLSLARDLNSIMEIVRTHARSLTEADGASFVLRDGDMCYYADEDAILPLWKGSRFPMNICISGWAMQHKEAVVIEDIYQDQRIPIDAYEPTFVKRLVMVPIRTLNPLGAIGIYWSDNHAATREEVALIRSLADTTAVAMENVNIYNELDKRVQERTAQLEAFSYSVAHDLKNPLTGMEMRISSLQDDFKHELDDSGHRIVQEMQEAVNEMKGMIGALLELCQLGTQGLNRTPIDMEEMVRKVAKEQKQQNPDKTIEIEIGDLPTEKIDPTLFRRVWTNLISNAVEYSKDRERVHIQISMEEKKGEHIYYIRDNGKGFPPEKANELFKAFQRPHGEPHYKGSGIGLSIVQQIVLKHEGTIWAEGEPNAGATFYISLPWLNKEDLDNIRDHPGIE